MMVQMRSRQWQSILEIIYSSNAHLEELTAFRRQVLRGLQKTIRADNANFFMVNAHLTPIDPIGINLSEKYLQLYQSHFFRLNPFDPSQVHIPACNVLVDASLYHLSDYKKTEYFNEFIKPQDVRRQMVLYLRSKQKLIGFIGLHRSDEKESFKSWELAVAETIAPLLSQSLERAQALEQAKVKELFFQAIINRAQTGAMVVNGDMEPVFINQAAVRLFKQMSSGGVPFEGMRPDVPGIPSQVHRLVGDLITRSQKMNHPPASPNARHCFSLPGLQTLTVNVELLSAPAQTGAAPMILITVEEGSSAAEPINESRLIQDYGLTKRELEIVHLIFKGLKNQEIAGLLFIAEGTVKNHVKNIYNKIGVATRTSLIHDILNY